MNCVIFVPLKKYLVSILIFLLVSYILLSISLYMLFPKAGEDAVKGLIPGVNFATWSKIIGRKPVYALWLLFPIVNIFIFCGMAVDMVRSFGKYSLSDSALAVIYSPLKFFMIAADKDAKYVGPTLDLEAAYKMKLHEAQKAGDSRTLNKLMAANPYQKSVGREWTEAIFFAVFAAAFIRMFLIEAYTIPTSSMEGSLRVGDYLFVSKAHYGIRTPQTILQIPLLHNRIPIFNKESYFSSPSLPYFRLPGLTTIKRNDPVVFNWPVGDKIYVAPSRTFAIDQVPEQYAKSQGWPYIERPMDKTDFYIKRCVAIAGDTLEIINKQLYINGKPAENPAKIQYSYQVRLPENINPSALEKLDAYPLDINGGKGFGTPTEGGVALNAKQVEILKELGAQVTAKRPSPSSAIFPNDQTNFPGQTIDNYGPIWIPKKGTTVTLSMENIRLFQRIIDVYENHNFEIKGKKFFIDGKEAKTYTFQWDYYWMMGDNRHNSEDSRYWGFVPETHVVGKPLFVWMSAKNGAISNGIRWDRVFTGARKMD